MPGAQLTGVDDGVYTGKVKIKVGPVTAEYTGTARFTEKDDAAYRAVINARGRDSRGQGNATAVISAQLRADGANTVVTVFTDLALAGRIAQFGSGMIKEVSAKLLGQFVSCLEEKLNAISTGVPADGAASTGGADVAASDGAGFQTASAAGSQATAAVPAEPAPLDLMSVAGSALYKRLLPVAVVLVVLIVVIIILVVG
jgi:carbon monoxide dehydrogenase subunit G